jgi:hypothetical protein
MLVKGSFDVERALEDAVLPAVEGVENGKVVQDGVDADGDVSKIKVMDLLQEESNGHVKVDLDDTGILKNAVEVVSHHRTAPILAAELMSWDIGP